MAEQKQFQTTFSVGGKVDPSFARSMGMAQSAINNLNKFITMAGKSAGVTNTQLKSWSPEIDKAQRTAGRLNDTMRRVSETAAGVALGSALFDGLKSALGFVERIGEGLAGWGEKASNAAAQFELMSRGMGALLRDQGFADNLLNALQITAYASPFQLTDLGSVARQLTGRGFDKKRLYQATTELGDITAGLGGGKDILDRLTLAYGESFDQHTIDKRILRQFSEAGVPIMDALMQSFGLDPKNAEQTQRMLKMVHDKKVTFQDLDKAIYNLTHNMGLFTDGMKHFAETHRGLLTTFEDMYGRAEREFGSIVNDIEDVFLKMANNSGLWKGLHNYTGAIRSITDALISAAEMDIPNSSLMKNFQPYIQGMENMFTGFNRWLGSFFDYADIPTQGQVTVLNATGEAKLKEYLDDLNEVLDKVNTSLGKIQRIGDAVGPALQGISRVATFLNSIDDLIYGTATMLVGKGIKGAGDVWNFVFGGEHKLHRQYLSGGTHQFGASRDYWPSDVPYFADGGVVTGPTLGVLGERGTEAVIPLSNPQIFDDLNDTIRTLNDFLSNMAPSGPLGTGGYGGGGSGSAWTFYGPKIDPPGSPYYDSDSYRGIGHIHGVPYSLQNGVSVAMHPEYAERVYGIKPGQWFKSNKDNQWHKWQDTSGSKNPDNEDFYKSSQSGNHYHFHINAIDSQDVERFLNNHKDRICRAVEDHQYNRQSNEALV